MNDALDVYNNTGSDIIVVGITIPASSFASIPATGAVSLAQDPFFQYNLITSQLGVSVYGQDLSYGLNSAADIWMQRVAIGAIVY